jgi:hypothetical protein
VVAVVEAALHPDRFPGWTARQALAERGDTIAVNCLLSAVAQGIFSAVLAINRIFQPHQLPKWQRHLLGTVPLRPARLESRLDDIGDLGRLDALVAAEALVYDTIEVAEPELGLRLNRARSALAEQRHPIEPPGGS